MTLLSESTLAALLNAAPDAMLSIDADGVIVMANVNAGRLFDYEHLQLVGQPVAPLMALEIRELPEGLTGVPMVARRREGGEFPAEISISTSSTGPDFIMTVVVRDVSVRSEIDAERVRDKSEAERVRLSVEAVRVQTASEKSVAEDVRIEAEVQRVIAEGEKSVAEDVRIEAEVQRVIAEGEKAVAEDVRLVAEDVRIEAEVQRVIAEGEKAVAEDVRLVAEDVRIEAEIQRVKAEGEKAEAERVRLEAEVQRVLAESEKTEAERVRLEAEVQRVIAEGEKIEAERVRLEAEIELERLEGQLHQSQRMESLGQLAGGVAHDFNNLLAVILNYAAFVTEELTNAVSAPGGEVWQAPLKDLHQIQVAAERAGVLTHQLLAFARREVIQARPLSINDAIRSVEEILRRTIGEQIELTTRFEPNLAHVIADPGHIEQIILNLAINARDAMPMGGALCIETSARLITATEWTMFGVAEGPYICIRISDNGGGMSPEVRDRAFEPFFTTKPRGEGSGLGLATVYGIVLQTGGMTKIYTDEGVGTTITILLPAAKLLSDLVLDDDIHPGPLGGTETILVVDDEEGLREVARRILTRNGYTVITATSGAEAIEIAQKNDVHIDLLLTDVIMPQMQGPTVVREVTKLLSDVKVLFMSGHAQPVLEAESVLGTEFTLVEKPFDQKILLDHVRRALDAVRSEEAIGKLRLSD